MNITLHKNDKVYFKNGTEGFASCDYAIDVNETTNTITWCALPLECSTFTSTCAPVCAIKFTIDEASPVSFFRRTEEVDLSKTIHFLVSSLPKPTHSTRMDIIFNFILHKHDKVYFKDGTEGFACCDYNIGENKMGDVNVVTGGKVKSNHTRSIAIRIGDDPSSYRITWGNTTEVDWAKTLHFLESSRPKYDHWAPTHSTRLDILEDKVATCTEILDNLWGARVPIPTYTTLQFKIGDCVRYADPDHPDKDVYEVTAVYYPLFSNATITLRCRELLLDMTKSSEYFAANFRLLTEYELIEYNNMHADTTKFVVGQLLGSKHSSKNEIYIVTRVYARIPNRYDVKRIGALTTTYGTDCSWCTALSSDQVDALLLYGYNV